MSTKKRNVTKVNLDISISILDSMISYIFTNNTNATKKATVRMKELFDILNEEMYQHDRQMEVRVFLIKKLLEGYIDKRITNYEMLAEYPLGGQYDDEILEIFREIDERYALSDDEVFFLDEYVSDRLTYGYIYQYEKQLDDKLLQLKSGDFRSLREYNEEVKSIVANLFNDMKKAESETRHAARDFGTDPESLDTALSQTITNLNKESNMIKTGVKWLNLALRGGFQAGRTYLFLGMAKGWKSGMLLNTVLWGKKYNPDIVTNDPTKRPCILYVTQENSVDETLERIWSYYIGEDTEIKDYTPEVAMAMLEEAGFNNDGIAIKIKYRPNKTINTADLDAMIDDLSLEGYEVILLVHDYVKRIRSIDKHTDLRLELGAIVDEFTVIAKTRNIPVVSASQLNREAFRVVEAANGSNKTNLAKQLGASHAGESMLMIENADYVFVQAVEEKKSTNSKYLTLKNIASRGKGAMNTYFAHPFENGMKLVEDIHSAKSASLADLGDDLANFDPNASNRADGEEGEAPASPVPSRNNKPQIRQRPTGRSNVDAASILGNMEIEV